MKTLFALLIIAGLACLPLVSCEVILGGSGGNVTLYNPDGSYFYFDVSNQTSYSYITNEPDGWWNIPTNISEAEEGWILALIIGLIALAIAIIVLVLRSK